MWPKAYKDYPEDKPLKKCRVEPGKGIIGCEMHEMNGYGLNIHHSPKPRKGLVQRLLETFFRRKKTGHDV